MILGSPYERMDGHASPDVKHRRGLGLGRLGPLHYLLFMR